MIDPAQFRAEVIRPTLAYLAQADARLAAPAAEPLLLGTPITESGLRYLRQHHGGPALGLYQIEPATHRDLYTNFLNARPLWRAWVVGLAEISEAAVPPVRSELITNLRYATAVARLIYWRAPDALPAADDIEGLAHYWKNHFNTRAGAGRWKDFVRKAGKYLETPT